MMKPIGPDAVVAGRASFGEQAHEDAAAVERRDGDEVEDGQVGVDEDGVNTGSGPGPRAG